MRIGFDVSQTGVNKAGCGYFADSLVRELVEIDPHDEFVLVPDVRQWRVGRDVAEIHDQAPSVERAPRPRPSASQRPRRLLADATD